MKSTVGDFAADGIGIVRAVVPPSTLRDLDLALGRMKEMLE